MLYYHRNAVIFYQLNPDTKTYVEVFSTGTQSRIMKISETKLYEETVIRINSMGFEETTEEVFTTKLNEVKNKF